MTGSSWPTSASTFWKKTIQGAILCDQSTCFDSSSCSRKLPAVWKNFFGTIGGRSLAPSSGTRSPVSAAPPRSNHSRIVGTSRTTISSPSTRPTRPSSNVTRRAMRPPPPRSGRAGRRGRRPSRSAPASKRRVTRLYSVAPSNSNVGSPSASSKVRARGRRSPGGASRAAPTSSTCSSSVCAESPASRTPRRAQLLAMVAEAARLRRAAAGARDRVPVRRNLAPGLSRCAGRRRGRRARRRSDARSSGPSDDSSSSAGTVVPSRCAQAPSSTGTGRSCGNW